MSKRKKDFGDSSYQNNRAFLQYFNRLKDIALSMFEWMNLPDTVDERYLETSLFTEGKAVWFNDPEIGILCLSASAMTTPNAYGYPMEIEAVSRYSGYHRKLKGEDCTIIYNNYIHTPSIYDIEYYASKLATYDRVIDVNVNAQKTPVLLVCDETEKLSVQNIYKDYDGNKPVIATTKRMATEQPLTSIRTDAPYISDKIYELKLKYWNEAMTLLGIPSVEAKKERMVTNEVEREQAGAFASRLSRLEMRKHACEEINRKFGLSIDVRYREGLESQYEIEEEVIDE